MTARCFALIPAGGIGSRTGAAMPKQYLSIAGRPMIAHTIAAFAAVAEIRRIVVVVARDDRHFDALALDDGIADRVEVHRLGGDTRARSVANGLAAMRGTVDADDWVLVHDAARCGVTPASIAALIAAVRDDAVGGLLALPLDDTVKREAAGLPGTAARVAGTVDRRGLWRAQTPQMFRHRMLADALAAADAGGLAVTDESSAIEAAGRRALLVPGSSSNFKVTTAQDLAMMDVLLRRRDAIEPPA